MFKIDKVEKVEITCHVVFPQLGGTDIMNRLGELGEKIMDKLTELEDSMNATLVSIESAKAAVVAEGVQVKTRIDGLIEQLRGITPGGTITEAKIAELLVTANSIRASADGLTTAIEGIYVPDGVITPPVPGATSIDIDGNIIASNNDIVNADGTVRYAVNTYTTDPAGHHLDQAGNIIYPV